MVNRKKLTEINPRQFFVDKPIVERSPIIAPALGLRGGLLLCPGEVVLPSFGSAGERLSGLKADF